MTRAALRVMLVVCLFLPFVACSNDSAEQQNGGHGSPSPSRAPAGAASSGTSTPPATAASEPAEHTVVENTVGGAVLRRDESVLNILQARLLRSKEHDEIFVKAMVKGPAEAKDCYLMRASTWFDLRDAIESENISDAPELLEVPWADPTAITRFSGNDTLAISFPENTDRNVEGPDTEENSFYAVCYKAANPESDVTWYDVAHVEGTPEAR